MERANRTSADRALDGQYTAKVDQHVWGAQTGHGNQPHVSKS